MTTNRTAFAHDPIDSKSMNRTASVLIAMADNLRNALGAMLSLPSPVLSGNVSQASEMAHGMSCENCSSLTSKEGSMYIFARGRPARPQFGVRRLGR